jgi:hypothetical protein
VKPGRRLALVALALVAAAAPGAAHEEVPAGGPTAAGAIAAGDAHYARRGEGANGERALPFEIDGAIAEYRHAIALDPGSSEARVSLMRADFFRGSFCGDTPPDEKVRFVDEAKRVGEETVARLDREMRRSKGSTARAGAAEGGRDARAYLWAAVSWGQWTLFHRLSAAWSGAPARIRELAEAVLAIDPATEQAGAYILLGRLHGEAPRVPFVTGWVSRKKAVQYVREGLKLAPDNRALVYFAADALLEHAPSSRAEARALLERCATSPPRPDFVAEDLHYARLARERLAGLR